MATMIAYSSRISDGCEVSRGDRHTALATGRGVRKYGRRSVVFKRFGLVFICIMGVGGGGRGGLGGLISTMAKAGALCSPEQRHHQAR